MILTFPYHDPDGTLNRAFRRRLGTLKSAFDAVCAGASPPTVEDNAAFVQYLRRRGCVVGDNPPGTTIADHSREALRLALECAQARQPIFFGFLDRILFALETEWRWGFLQDLRVYQPAEFLIFERSQAAWDTHPANYREIERMVSRTFELLWGEPIELSPCAFILSHAAAETILSRSISASFDVWGEWVLLAMKEGIPITRRKVDWLAWEHPYWERVESGELRQRWEVSQEETVRRIRMNVPQMLLLTEERFRDTRLT